MVDRARAVPAISSICEATQQCMTASYFVVRLIISSLLGLAMIARG